MKRNLLSGSDMAAGLLLQHWSVAKCPRNFHNIAAEVGLDSESKLTCMETLVVLQAKL